MRAISRLQIGRLDTLSRTDWLALGAADGGAEYTPRSIDEWLLRDAIQTLCFLACGHARSCEESRRLAHACACVCRALRTSETAMRVRRGP